MAPDSWGVRYIGNWALGKKEGQGTMFYMDNSKYEGQWKADVPHGKGTLTLSTGDIYAGAFKNGKPAGTGQFTHVTSSVIHQGKFAMGIKDGKCTITRLVSEQEKAEALKSPPMDKLVGTVVDGRVTCTNAAYAVCPLFTVCRVCVVCVVSSKLWIARHSREVLLPNAAATTRWR